MHAALLLAVIGITGASAQTYSLTDTYEGADFFGKFDFYTGADPTDGFVDYLDYSDAVSQGLISNPAVAAWGVDNTTVLSVTSSGRASVRMSSTASYNHGLFIADIAHMPSSTCGLWPAYWLLGGGTWPAEGELDIIEGVNTATTNSITGHTSAGCTIENTGSGVTETTTCDSSGADDTGCGVEDTGDTSSFGTGFNDIGGGVYAVEWTSDGFSVWFFHRDAIPSTITSSNPDPSDFGTPVATFSGSGCDFDEHFQNMQIIFDTTFCGDWAGVVFDDSPYYCGSSCVEYVADNPSVYDEAYWSINYINVYATDVADGAEETGTSTSASTATPTTVGTTSTSVGAGSVSSAAVSVTSNPSSLATATTQSTSSSTSVAASTTLATSTTSQAATSTTSTSTPDSNTWTHGHHGYDHIPTIKRRAW